MSIFIKIFNLSNLTLFCILITTFFLLINNLIDIRGITTINNKIAVDELIINEDYEELSIYSSAYLLGKQGEYKNAIEKYNMLLKIFPTTNIIDIVYYIKKKI